MVEVVLGCLGLIVLVAALFTAYTIVYEFLSPRSIPRVAVVILSLYLATWVVWVVPLIWLQLLFTGRRRRAEQIRHELEEEHRRAAEDGTRRARLREEARASELRAAEEHTRSLKAQRLHAEPSLFDQPPS